MRGALTGASGGALQTGYPASTAWVSRKMTSVFCSHAVSAVIAIAHTCSFTFAFSSDTSPHARLAGPDSEPDHARVLMLRASTLAQCDMVAEEALSTLDGDAL